MTTHKERHEKLMKDLEDLNQRTGKEMDEVLKKLMKEVNFSEESILNSMDKSIRDYIYTDKYIASAPEFKRKLLKEHKDLQKSIDILTHRQHEIKNEIEREVRDNLISSDILGTIQWEVNRIYSKEGRVYLKASLKDNDKIYEFIKDPFGYDYHWHYIIYTFPNGKNIDMTCDDGELSIDLNDDKISPEEYRSAFKELGIKISFDTLKRDVKERRDAADRLQKIIDLFSKKDGEGK